MTQAVEQCNLGDGESSTLMAVVSIFGVGVCFGVSGARMGTKLFEATEHSFDTISSHISFLFLNDDISHYDTLPAVACGSSVTPGESRRTARFRAGYAHPVGHRTTTSFLPSSNTSTWVKFLQQAGVAPAAKRTKQPFETLGFFSF